MILTGGSLKLYLTGRGTFELFDLVEQLTSSAVLGRETFSIDLIATNICSDEESESEDERKLHPLCNDVVALP